MQCNKCGTEIPDGSNFCSFCGESFSKSAEVRQTSPTTPPVENTFIREPVKPKKKKKIALVICLCIVFGISSFFAFILIMSSLFGVDTEVENNDTSVVDTVLETENNGTEETSNREALPFFEDDVIKASLINVYDDELITGASYLQLHIENKTDKSLTIALSEASLNGMSTTFGSGVPMVISPSNSSEQPFILFYGSTSISSVSDINKIQFRFYIMDENTETVEETDFVVIER